MVEQGKPQEVKRQGDRTGRKNKTNEKNSDISKNKNIRDEENEGEKQKQKQKNTVVEKGNKTLIRLTTELVISVACIWMVLPKGVMHTIKDSLNFKR